MVASVLASLCASGAAWIEGGDRQVVDFRTQAVSHPPRLIKGADGTLTAPQVLEISTSGSTASTTSAATYDPAYWSPPNGSATWSGDYTLTSAGLTPGNTVGSERWVETEPFHTGSDGRPLTGLTVSIRLQAKGLPPAGHFPRPLAFVRYSTNGKLWSTWMAVATARDDFTTGLENYSSVVAIAAPDQVGYEAAFREWAYPDADSGRRSPFTGKNQHVFYTWLLEHHPQVLEKEVPLIRFMQVRMENLRDATLERIETKATWMVGGLSQ